VGAKFFVQTSAELNQAKLNVRCQKGIGKASREEISHTTGEYEKEVDLKGVIISYREGS